jgi:hypothetical protein
MACRCAWRGQLKRMDRKLSGLLPPNMRKMMKNVPVVPPFFSFGLAPAIQQDFQHYRSVTNEKSI